MKTAKEFWKEKIGENPEHDSAKFTVAMMQQYADEVVNDLNTSDVAPGSYTLEDLKRAYTAGFSKHCELINENMYDAHWAWANKGFEKWVENGFAANNAVSKEIFSQKVKSIAETYHDRVCMSMLTMENQVCKCCGSVVRVTTSIEHDSQDHSKDLSVCTNCYEHIVNYWKMNRPGKIAPI
jgi:hypothetical protein